MQFKSNYKGQLRTVAEHLGSGDQLITDAPIDNNGKGETFSPTDLVATALWSCMMTIMAIEAKKYGMRLGDLTWETTKVMRVNPRTISKIKIHFSWPNCLLTDDQRAWLKEKGLSCPVALALHPDIIQEVTFDF